MHFSRAKGRGTANGLPTRTSKRKANAGSQNQAGQDGTNPPSGASGVQQVANNQPPPVDGNGGGAGGGTAVPTIQPDGAPSAPVAGGSGWGKGGKGVSRAELTSLRSTFSKELQDMKASIIDCSLKRSCLCARWGTDVFCSLSAANTFHLHSVAFSLFSLFSTDKIQSSRGWHGVRLL